MSGATQVNWADVEGAAKALAGNDSVAGLCRGQSRTPANEIRTMAANEPMRVDLRTVPLVFLYLA